MPNIIHDYSQDARSLPSRQNRSVAALEEKARALQAENRELVALLVEAQQCNVDYHAVLARAEKAEADAKAFHNLWQAALSGWGVERTLIEALLSPNAPLSAELQTLLDKARLSASIERILKDAGIR